MKDIYQEIKELLIEHCDMWSELVDWEYLDLIKDYDMGFISDDELHTQFKEFSKSLLDCFFDQDDKGKGTVYRVKWGIDPSYKETMLKVFCIPQNLDPKETEEFYECKLFEYKRRY